MHHRHQLCLAFSMLRNLPGRAWYRRIRQGVKRWYMISPEFPPRGRQICLPLYKIPAIMCTIFTSATLKKCKKLPVFWSTLTTSWSPIVLTCSGKQRSRWALNFLPGSECILGHTYIYSRWGWCSLQYYYSVLLVVYKECRFIKTPCKISTQCSHMQTSEVAKSSLSWTTAKSLWDIEHSETSNVCIVCSSRKSWLTHKAEKPIKLSPIASWDLWRGREFGLSPSCVLRVVERLTTVWSTAIGQRTSSNVKVEIVKGPWLPILW